MAADPTTERPQLDRLNTIDEVAAFAKVSKATVKRAIAAGRLEVLRAGVQVRVLDSAVWRWLDGR